jgi:hypothetical protein
MVRTDTLEMLMTVFKSAVYGSGGARTAPSSKNHLTETDLANRWALSPSTLARWRYQGLGPVFLKIHGRVAYRLSDIEAYEAKSLRSSTSSAVTPQLAGALA